MKIVQAPHTLLMVRPLSFNFNIQTEATNTFQIKGDSTPDIQRDVVKEFDLMVETLLSHDISVKVFEDTPGDKPDAIFPNNWISFQPDGKVILYPMMAPNRRAERRRDIIDAIAKEFAIQETIDLTAEENKGKYLEGTGSIVFDHLNQIAFASLSPRTDRELVEKLCEILQYRALVFHATDADKKAIYHTNVVMSVGTKFAIVCLDAIPDEEQEVMLEKLSESGRRIIAISYDQMYNFAGNILEVLTSHGESAVLMSERAINSLLPGQINAIAQFAEIIPLNVNTIERYGGGSVRCMVAGIHTPKRKLL